MSPTEPTKARTEDEDEVITVTLSRSDYEILRNMIDREQVMSLLGKWLQNFLVVTIGGLVALFTFGGQVRDFILTLLAGSHHT